MRIFQTRFFLTVSLARYWKRISDLEEVILEVEIGGCEHEYLLVDVFRRTRPSSIDYWDGNWLITKISISVGGFTSHIN